MKQFGLAAVAFVLAGCAHKAAPLDAPFISPDGRKGFSVSCSHERDTLATCHSKARTLCKGDYEVIDQSEMGKLGTNKWSGTQSTVAQRAMNVACKTPPQ